MNLVVSFLSMLGEDEGNGGVKRMLGVCSEFERIAKVVLDKAEKDSSSRKKRKSHEDPAKAETTYPPNSAVHQTPMNTHPPAMAGVFPLGSMSSQVNPRNGLGPFVGPGSPNSGVWQPDFSNGSEYMTPNDNSTSPFQDIDGFTNGSEMNSPLNPNAFQQPFVPQDLWQMPMTIEWDWADMTGGQYPSFENGIIGDPALQHSNNQHLQNQQMP